MRARHGWVWVLLLCQVGRPAGAAGPPAQGPEGPAAPALGLWQQGQQAMIDGQAERAIPLYRRSLELDPGLVRNHLSLAAAFIALGEDGQAAPHLARYVRAQPDHLVIRAHYAELLLRLRQPREARAQFERFVADVQDRDDLARQYLLHCHSRLMEIAEGEADGYGEHLHRGIGLYLLARERERLPDPDGELSAEGLLFRAAGELALARAQRGDEARACWYLHEVWSHLAQRQPAQRWLRAAEGAAPLGDLTPAEQRDLQLAWRHRLLEGQRK
jgi:tetratricopeptide (TPR) repeat protein